MRIQLAPILSCSITILVQATITSGVKYYNNYHLPILVLCSAVPYHISHRDHLKKKIQSFHTTPNLELFKCFLLFLSHECCGLCALPSLFPALLQPHGSSLSTTQNSFPRQVFLSCFSSPYIGPQLKLNPLLCPVIYRNL